MKNLLIAALMIGAALPSAAQAQQATINQSIAGTRLDVTSKGEGPREQLVALGYAGWAPGQLENEIAQNGWLTVQADLDVIFNVPPEARYEAAMQALGVNAAFLSEEAGHA